MPREPIDRKLAALLSADAVGYSRLMAEDEDATGEAEATWLAERLDREGTSAIVPCPRIRP